MKEKDEFQEVSLVAGKKRIMAKTKLFRIIKWRDRSGASLLVVCDYLTIQDYF